MKIHNSSITMSATHHESSFSYKESMTMEAAKSKGVVGAILTLSQEASGKSVKDAMVDYQKQEKEEAKKKKQENEARSIQEMAERMRTENTGNQYDIPDDIDMKIKLLRQILAALRGEKVPEDCKIKPSDSGSVTDLRSAQFKKLEGFEFNLSTKTSVGLGSISIDGIGTNRTGTTWQKITATSGFISESESTTFATKGIVQTADGRNIDFNMEVSMSRAFMQETNLLEVKEYIKTDPLMINLDTNIGAVSDQKFFFDLDADGKEEKISFAGQGSGFLALDKNGDGKINDGSELFGTSSGDGFKDLATYDEDGNGWIDENDSIFNRLKVWTKDENGNDFLIDLKKADVGAIYLRNADTQFSLKDDENELNAEIKKTGIYLRESTGAVGTLNHVDLVV
ncbi:MAG: hypothetical protein Q4F06_04925 [Eubacteriales bacterium]|nr:hypothetical protein [Eubacteriales bacterium]